MTENSSPVYAGGQSVDGGKVSVQLQDNASIIEASKYCQAHINNETTYYCHDHDHNFCTTCIEENHQNCDSVVLISEIAEDEIYETKIPDLQRRMSNLCQNMEKIMAEFANGLANLERQKVQVKQKILDFRTRINLHLNKLECDLLNELSAMCNDFRDKSDNIIKDLRGRYEHLMSWKSDDVTSGRSDASKINLFQACKFLDSTINLQEAVVEEIKSKATAKVIEFEPTETESFFNYNIGSLTSFDMPFSAKSTSDHKEKRLSLVMSFQTAQIAERLKVFRAWFIPRKKLLLCGFNQHCLYACDHDGSDSKLIPLKHQPLGVAVYDSKRAIATLGPDGIQIINLASLTAGRQIETEGNCWAICISNGKIWVRSDAWTLSNIDIHGNILRQIKTIFDPRDFFISVQGDIYSTSNYGDALYKVSTSEEQTEFYSSPDLKLPKGVIVDKRGFVYVDGYITYNIHRISPEGRGEVVLGINDGINQPRGLTYDLETDLLLIIVNDGETINIYTIK